MNRNAVLGGIVLLGFALRLFHLNTVPLRGDEAFTVIHWMREPLAQTLANIATVDPQAPLSYALYRGWALIVGAHENVARFLPALLSLLGIPAIYALGHRLRGARLGLLAAFLWAVNPNQIWHAQDARNYAIWSALSLMAIWLALRALDRQRRIDWLLYVAAGALAAYVYYLELFVVLVLNLYVFATRWRDRPLLLRWVTAQIAIGLLLAPWYLQPRLLFGSGYGGTAGQFDAPQLLTRFIPTLTFSVIDKLPADFASLLAAALGLALLIGLLVWWRRNRRQVLLVGLLGTAPLLLLGIVSTRLNVFEPRYVLAAAPAYLLILGALVVALRNAAARTAGILLALVSLLFLAGYYFQPDYAKSPDWRALAAYLSANVQPDEWVTQAAADMSFVFYCQEYRITAVCDDQLPANPDQSAEEIERLLTTRSQEHAAIWYVAQPQNWQNAGAAQSWLESHLQPVRRTAAGGLRVLEFKPWEVAPDEIQSAPLATFGGAVQLVGVQTTVEPTGELTVWLYWRPLTATDAPLKVFLHLLSLDQIAAQDDQYPQDGRIDTTSGQHGQPRAGDIYTLPLGGVPTGDYALVVGFYNPETNRRLLVGDGDSFTIETIHLP